MAAAALEPASHAVRAPEVEVRLPLQTGVTSVWNAARAALFTVDALVLAALPVFVLADGVVVSFFLTVPALGLFVYGWICLYRAVRHRVSDVVITRDGVRIEGGAHHGEQFAWSEIQYVSMVQHEEERTTFLGIMLTSILFWVMVIFALIMKDAEVLKGFSFVKLKVNVTQLGITVAGRPVLIVAETDEGIEADSLQAAADSIRAVASGRTTTHERPAAAHVQVVHCDGCGAPTPASEAATAACEFCGTTVYMPPQVRSQASAHRSVAVSHAAFAPLLAALVSQPKPQTRNKRLLWSTLVMFAASPLVCLVVWWLRLRGGHMVLGPLDVALLFVPVVVVLAFAFHLRAPLADRFALQLLSLGFGALAPAQPGQPPSCRRCLGPLATHAASGLSTCLYCGADNVIGIDLRSAVTAARAEQVHLDETLRTLVAEKRRWRALAILADVLTVASLIATVGYVVAANQ